MEDRMFWDQFFYLESDGSIPFQLADALMRVAYVNHYMVGLVYKPTRSDIDAAEQILIRWENAWDSDDSIVESVRFDGKNVFDIAFDLINDWVTRDNMGKDS